MENPPEDVATQRSFLAADRQEQLASQVARMLRPGGVFSFVEISVPGFPPLRAAYMLYIKCVIPLLGCALLGNPKDYRLLGAYTESFEDCRHFARSLRDAGLEACFVGYFFGCATGVIGCKPEDATERIRR